MTIPAGVERVLGVVGLHQIDTTGGLQQSLDETVEGLATGPRMTGVQNQSHAEITDLVPKSRYPLDPTCHRLVPSGGVLDQDRHVRVQGLEGLSPPDEPFLLGTVPRHMTAVHHDSGRIDLGGGVTGVLKDLSARYSNPVVVGADIDQIRSVDVDGDRGVSECLGVISGHRLLPRLRIGEEDLNQVGAPRLGLGERVH